LAEFVDNSTQAYLDNADELDPVLVEEGGVLRVDIAYSSADGSIVVSDNSIGMDAEVLDRAMTVGEPPPDPTGRSQYGMGLKTAACWLGDYWTVRTTRLGNPVEYTVTVDVNAVADGDMDLPTQETEVDAKLHYTIITITQLNVSFLGRRVGKVRDYLASMYREDLRTGWLRLRWQGEVLRWDDAGRLFLTDPDGKEYRREVRTSVNGKPIEGWVGVLASGGRSQAGFSIFRSGRMVRGFPQSWRPQEVFGQEEGSNNLINQRVVGEFHFDAFPVTHTKDDILWADDEESAVELAIREEIEDLLIVADRTRVRSRQGPQRGTINKVRRSIQRDAQEATAARVDLEDPVVEERLIQAADIADRYSSSEPDVDFSAVGRRLRAYFADEEEPDSVFAAISAGDSDSDIVVVANLRHPFLDEVSSAEALDVYLRSLLIEVATLMELTSDGETQRWVGIRDSLMRTFENQAGGS
jgi:hypothetical protein